MTGREYCSWLSDAEHHQLNTELQEIESSLIDMGASKDYYLNYFRQSGGCCDKIVNGQCIRHSCRQAPLPPGKMCSIEFVRAAVLLRQQIERVEEERRVCRREWDQLKARTPDDQRQAKHSDHPIRFDRDSNSYFFRRIWKRASSS